jgi:uncharacterized membrane protein
MSKADYFKELTYRLRGLREKERENIISVYEELFQKATQNGKNEDEIAESLGYPRIPNWDGAKQEQQRHQQNPGAEPNYSSQPERDAFVNAEGIETYANPYANPYARPYQDAYHNHYPVKTETGLKAIIASIALGFFNLVLVLGPFVGICGMIIALYASSAACLISPLLLLIGNNWTNISSDMQLLVFGSMAVFGIGILLTAFTVWFSKGFFKLVGKYIRFNIKIIKGA